MARTHKNFRELKDSTHGEAKATGPHETVKTRVSGAAAPKTAADKKRSSKRLAEGLSLGLAMAGLRPKHRADRPGRKKGGRVGNDTVNVVVAGSQPSGVAPPVGLLGRSPVGSVAAPVGASIPSGRAHRAGNIGITKGSSSSYQSGVSGSPSFANGGSVSHGESLHQIRKRTQT
jgi:hypothetical protein